MNDRLTADRILDGWHQLRTTQPDLSTVEIAQALGVNYNTLYSVVRRATARDDPRAVPGRGNVGRSHRRPLVVPFDPCTLDEGEQS